MANNDPTKTFQFSVDNQGKFVYDPPGDWAYNHTDRIRFQTKAGAFKIAFLPIGGIVNPNFNPLGGPLTSTQGPDGTSVADTSVNDGLTQAERQILIWAHVEAAHPNGYIARYHYAIDVTDKNGKVSSDAQKNGTYSC